MEHYQPYTYLIGWSKLDRWYYGVEYACNARRVANPCNLWVTYFTSSKLVKTYVDLYGNPDIIQVRKVFLHKKNAIEWENRVLKRLDVTKQDRWLNQHHSVYNFDVRGEANPRYGKTASAETRKKMSDARKGWVATPEYREKQRQKSTGRKHTPETKQKIKDSNIRRAENGSLYFQSQQAKDFNSFRLKGKTFDEIHGEDSSAAIKQKMSAARVGKVPWNKGISPSSDTRLLMSSSHKGKSNPTLKGMVVCVDTTGTVLRVPVEEFQLNSDLVGVASKEGIRRREKLKLFPM